MNVTTKTIISMLLATTTVGAGTAVADSRQPTWQDYRSTVTSMPVSKSYNDIEVSKYDIDKTKTTTTTTDNSKRADDSFNRSLDVDVDASRSTDDSYNTANIDKSRRSAEFDLDASRHMDDSYNTDSSKHAADSFNRSTEVDVDASRRMKDSYNTDQSRHAKDSYNTDKSIKDSYNTANNQRQAAVTDTMSSSQFTKSIKDVSAGDTQGASNNGYLSGPTQTGYQGSVDVGGIGNDAPSYGGWGGGSEYGYGGGGDQRKFRNDQEIAVYGPNLGAVSNTSVVNQGRDLVFGPNRSAIGNDFGNKQVFATGDQTQLMQNDQLKSGNNAASAIDNVSNAVSKSSSTKTQ